MRRNLFLVLALVLAVASGAFAQGSQTGTLSGTVLSSDRQPLPGVTVGVKSPSLLGTRSAVTDANGGYIFKALPPGTYKVTYDLAGFATVEKTVTVALGSTVPADATMKVATVQETVTVTAETPTPLSTTQVGANLQKETVDTLATGRTIQGIATARSGPHHEHPERRAALDRGQLRLRQRLPARRRRHQRQPVRKRQRPLHRGRDRGDPGPDLGHLRRVRPLQRRRRQRHHQAGRQPVLGQRARELQQPLVAGRDAVREGQRHRARGQDQQVLRGDHRGAHHQGPALVLRGRPQGREPTPQATSAESGIPFSQLRDQKRYEGKLSGAINPNHTLSATYTKVDDKIFRTPFGAGVEIDPIHTAYNGEQPNELFNANYNGVLKPNLFAELQYSRKKFSFQNSGGTSKNLVDSPILALTTGFFAYNAPYFDATDPEDRNNRQIAASLSYFASTSSLGKHDIKVGYENYRSTRTGGNSQSSTDWVFYADWPTDANGKPVFDSNGYVIPVFSTGDNYAINYQAVRGAQIDLTTQAVYVNDRWTLNNHWSFNLGARAEWAGARPRAGSSRSTRAASSRAWARPSTRKGDGKFKLDATYSHYAGKYSETQFAANTNVGNPDAIYYLYTGPSGQGRSFAPGFDLANYTEVFGGSFATANVFYDSNIKSPITKEWTAAAGMQLGSKGYIKAIYTHRNVTDFVQIFVNTSTGTTNVVKDGVDFGTFSNQLWSNTNDGQRKYDGLQFQTAYRLTSRWNFSGNYTLQINNDGNQEGEGTNTPGTPSYFSGFYPEIFNEARTYPIGRLNGYQKHRARAWTTYDLGLGRAGNLNAGLLWRLDTGSTYSIRSTGRAFSTIQRTIAAALYPDLPGTTQSYFYSEGRGSRAIRDRVALRPVAHLRPAHLQEAQHLGQGRDAQHVQLHAAHQPQHHGGPRPQQPARFAGAPDRLHQGRQLRQGNGHGQLPVPARVLRLGGPALLVARSFVAHRRGGRMAAPPFFFLTPRNWK